MRQSEGSSTVRVPLWLTAVVAILLVARIGLAAYERSHPLPPGGAIRWIAFGDSPVAASPGKLVLYDFSAAWCGPCRTMADTTFLDRDVIACVNENFVPVSVIDRRAEDGRNPDKVANLQERYEVSVFPTFVVTTPDGLTVSYDTGLKPAGAFLKFLEQSRQRVPAAVGRDAFVKGRYEEAANLIEAYLTASDWKSDDSADLAVRCALAHLKRGDRAAFDSIVTSALQKVSKDQPLYPLFPYFAGEVGRDKLAMRDRRSQRWDTVLRIYTAVFLNATGHQEDAMEELEWVEAKGRRDVDVFDVAINELKLLRSDRKA